MKKKGVIWEELADLFLGGLILFIAISSFLLVTGLHEKKVEEYFNEKTLELDDDEILIAFLKSETNSSFSLAERIITERHNGGSEALADDIDTFLSRVYGEKVCWEFFDGEKVFMKRNECRKEQAILDSSVAIPSFGKEVIEARLHIKGYAK